MDKSKVPRFLAHPVYEYLLHVFQKPPSSSIVTKFGMFCNQLYLILFQFFKMWFYRQNVSVCSEFSVLCLSLYRTALTLAVMPQPVSCCQTPRVPSANAAILLHVRWHGASPGWVVKNVPLRFCLYLRQLMADFHNSFCHTLQTVCNNVIIIYLTRP